MKKLLLNKKFIAIGIVIVIIAIFVLLFKDNIMKMIYPKKYEEYVSIYADKYQVGENLIFALIKAESNFNKDSVSNKGAIGLMQLMEETAIDVANKNNIELDKENIREDLLKVDKNIDIGTKYLSMKLERYGNIEIALAAYNAGIGTVDNWIEKGIINSDGSNIENIPYKETNIYVRKILRDYKIYSSLYEG